MVGNLKPNLIVGIFCVALLTTFNNCGKVEIRSLEKSAVPSPVVGSSEKIDYINIPETPEQQLRAVFLLDMSRSMISGPCADSVDVLVQGVTAVDCHAPTGVDVVGNRFRIIRDWIDQVQGSVNSGILKETQVRLMLVPFTGGMQEGMMNNIFSQLNGSKNFATLSDFRHVLNKLEALHLASLSESPKYPPYIPAEDQNSNFIKSKANALIYLGTSVPGTRIDQINTGIAKELDALKAGGHLRSTQFEIAFLSDGVAKPRPDHIKGVIDLIWTIKKYRALDRTYCFSPPNWQFPDPCDDLRNYEETSFAGCKTTCSAEATYYSETGQKPTTFSPSCKTCMDALEDFTFKPGDQSYGYNNNNFTNTTRLYWGNWEDNTHTKLFIRFATMINLFRKHAGARYRFNFLRLDASDEKFEIPEIELDPKLNWINKAQQLYVKGHRFTTQKNSQSPFSLFTALKNNERYQVSQVFAINLNARVNSYGALEVDSDGDGLPDILETTRGYDLSKPRSDGKCLDGVKELMNGCINVGCDPELDEDADGLNECEERTLGTDPNDFDGDGDGIPDGYEVLYGFNPLTSDRTKTSSMDGQTNLTHFQRGAVSEVDLSRVEKDRLVHFIANLKDQKLIKDSHGRTINSPGYFFELGNIPLVATSKAADDLKLYRNHDKAADSLLSFNIMNGSHGTNENRVLFLIRVDSLDNAGDSFWVRLEQTLKYSPDAKQSISINYGDFKLLDVTDPQGEVK